MAGLVFFYYIVCYSLGICGFFVALLSAVAFGSKPDGLFALFSASLTLTVLSFTLSSYPFSSSVAPIVVVAIAGTSISGNSLMVYALPRFVHSLISLRHRKAMDGAALGFAAAVTLTFGLFYLAPTLAFAHFIGVAIAIPIVYSTSRGVILLVGGWVRLEGSFAKADAERWKFFLGSLSIVSLAYMPLFAFLDFFPDVLPALSRILPRDVKAFPSFYAVVNLLYMRKTLPLLLRELGIRRGMRVRGAGEKRFDLEGIDLSPREREVAAMLLDGLSYKEIAAALGISLATVKTHIERIYRKSGTSGKMSLVRFARRG